MSTSEIKHFLKRLVLSENKDDPFSDKTLHEMIEERFGVKMVRRLIAKYRQELDIPSYKNLKDYISNQNYLKKDGSINPTNLLTYAAAVSASADLDIPSFKNVKEVVGDKYTLVKWDIDPSDWNYSKSPSNLIEKRILKRLQSG